MLKLLCILLALTQVGAGPIIWQGDNAKDLTSAGYLGPKAYIDGLVDVTRFTIPGSATQTTPLMLLEMNDGTDVVSVSNTGVILLGDPPNNSGTIGAIRINNHAVNGGSLANILITNNNASGSAGLLLRRSQGSPASPTIVTDGDVLGQLLWGGYEGGVTYRSSAGIQGIVDGTPGSSSDMPTSLDFSVAVDGSGTRTTRMRIRADGDIDYTGSQLKVIGVSGTTPTVELGENPANGTDAVALKSPASLTAGYSFIMPPDDGDAGEVLSTTDGAGTLDWITALTNPLLDGFMIDGSADEVQLTVQGNGTQTSPLMTLETSAGTDVLTVSVAGGVIEGDVANSVSTQAFGTFGTTTNATAIRQRVASATAFSELRQDRARGTVGSPTIVSANDVAGQLEFNAYDGAAYQNVVEVSAFVDGTPGANDMPGGLVFGMTPDGTAASLNQIYFRQNGDINLSGSTVGPQKITFGEDADNGINYVAIVAPSTLASDFTMTLPAATDTIVGKATSDVFTNKSIDADGTGNVITNIDDGEIKTGAAITRAKLANGTASHVLINDGSGVITSEAVLAVSRGGGNKALTLAAGGLLWTDADSFEVGAAGTAQMWALSGGTGAPTFSNTTTTAKVVDGSADAVQLTVEGHSTQTSNILDVQKSDATKLFSVTNVNGALIRGTTTNDAAATGFVGEYLDANPGGDVTPTNGSYVAVTSKSLTAGDWDCDGTLQINSGDATFTSVIPGLSLNSTSLDATNQGGMTRVPGLVLASDNWLSTGTRRFSLSGTTTIYLTTQVTGTVGTARFKAGSNLHCRRYR